MATINTRQINGVMRTSEPVWSNLERLAEACTSWFTYDVHTGLYSWVINEVGNSTASITEADIIGAIQISGSGLTNLYNSVEIEYPNTVIRDQPHYVRIDLPGSIRNAYEPDNTLQITSEFINNQPQAMAMADITLRQSRLDRSVTIVMDYTRINLRAGDIIDITSDTYAFVNKLFRIMRVREIEGDDGSLRLEFQLVEYDDSIYTGDISEFLVGGVPGIRGLGTIGQPGTPTVEIVTLDSLPEMTVTTTVPTGIVDRVQFWAGNIAATGNINTTTFDLYGTEASSDADSFSAGGTVTFETTALRDGDWIWKTRGTNTHGAGPFSDLSGNVQYQRLQAPDVIKVGTPLVNNSGTVISSSVQKSGQFAFASAPVDTLQYTGNSAYQGMIFTADAFMAGIGLDVANVSGTIAPAANVVVSINQSTTLLADTRADLGISAGAAIYLATAPWSDTIYANAGFAGLNWSSWTLIGLTLDPLNHLAGNLRVTTSSDSIVNFDGQEGKIVAFGFSSTLIPDDWIDIVPTTDPATGVPVITYSQAFVGNTVIFDAGDDIIQIPGITAANTLINGQSDSWVNYRFIV